MATEAMLEKPAIKVSAQTPKLGIDLFFVTRDTTLESSKISLALITNAALAFPMDSVIKKELDIINRQVKKDPSILTNMTSTIGVEQIA